MSIKHDLMEDLGGGEFRDTYLQVFAAVASAAINIGGAGKVSLNFKVKQIGPAQQVMVDHELKYTKTTEKGAITESYNGSTPMYLHSDGSVAFFPENQTTMFGKRGDVLEHGA